MIIKCYGRAEENLLFIDLEFSQRTMIQFAGLLFKKIDDETYQLSASCNVYITETVGYHFMEYTNITNDFLKNNGIPLESAQELIKNKFLKDVKLGETAIIAHGIKNDMLVLAANGLDLLNDKENRPVQFCTHIAAQKILGLKQHLTLKELATEAGYYMQQSHNAYNDVWAEVALFTYLCKRKGELDNEND